MSNPGTTLEKATFGTLPRIRVEAGEQGALINMRELLRYRDLLVTLAERDIRIRYKQTVLGVAWVVLQPLMSSLIFAFVFGVIARLPSDGRPYLLLAFAGMTAWNTFSNILTRVSNSLVGNSQMIAKIYFPRLILPLSATASALFDAAFSLGLMLVMLLLYQVLPGWGILLLPLWLAALGALALGLGLMAASMMVSYRDVVHILPVVLQLGLFITPVAWSMTAVPEKYRWLFWFNPLSSLMEACRWSLLGEGHLPVGPLACSITVTAAVFWMGAIVFKQQERSFADVI
jgi:lipopolysaccharide transport system permease protein